MMMQSSFIHPPSRPSAIRKPAKPKGKAVVAAAKFGGGENQKRTKCFSIESLWRNPPFSIYTTKNRMGLEDFYRKFGGIGG